MISLFLVLSLVHLGATPLQSASIVRVENAGLLFTDNQAGVSGTDAGYSIPLEKQTLWLFGDCFLLDPKSPARNYVGAVSNCGLVVPKGSGIAPLKRYRFLTDPKTGLARQLVDSETVKGKDLRFWPFGGWYDPARKKVFLYYGRVRTTGAGPLDFRTEGFGLAEADADRPERLRFDIVPSRPGEELWWPNEAGKAVFGSAVVAGSPGDYLYVVGFQQRAGKRYGKLARVEKPLMSGPAAYRYFAGEDRWSEDIGEAADVEGLTDFPTELSVAYNPYLGGYLAVHSVGTSDRARLSLAPKPWGPFKLIAEIGTPRQALTQGLCYAGKEHPELAEERGRIVYVTYVDQHRYWLQLLKITLQRHGPTIGLSPSSQPNRPQGIRRNVPGSGDSLREPRPRHQARFR
jgi:hypothetical protein